MASVVPDSRREDPPEERASSLTVLLDSLLEFTGATVGWIGLADAQGRLTFPVRRGDFPDAWLTLQQARGTVWGFAVREGPALLNELPPLLAAGPAGLRNLLTCPIGAENRGQIVLANKPKGFTSYDSAVLQGFAHLLARWVGPDGGLVTGVSELPTPWPRLLDQAGIGILLLDEAGTLLYANAAWLEWTGFTKAELIGKAAPFPFWISHRELAQLSEPQQENVRPFRRRDGTCFWCAVRNSVDSWQGRRLTVAYLQAPLPAEAPSPKPQPSEPANETTYVLPSPDWLLLLLRPTGEVSNWNERWEKLTGLTVPQGTRSELVLDWLFPRQREREMVADWFHSPTRRGGQAVLDMVTPTGSQPMLCTLLPFSTPELTGVEGEGTPRTGEQALLLVGEPNLFVGDGGVPSNLMRQFARGLGVLLNQYLTVPIGLAEEALSQPDLPNPIGTLFQQILDSCQKSSRLIAALEDLSAVSPGETQRLPLAAIVNDFLDELPPAAERPYQIQVDIKDATAPVQVNPRMLRTVLRHLFTNAVEALTGYEARRISLRVEADEETVHCEIQDTGEGFPSEEWLRSPAPFHSTKGPFAHDPAHAALEATGLGLTVCRHLLMLHHGRLELTSTPGLGTTATLILPRADARALDAEETADLVGSSCPASRESVRTDAATPLRGPHREAGRPLRREPPDEG